MLRSYFDASFTAVPGITAVAGYIGTEAQWARVEAEWAENLRIWGLGDFHLADLPHQIGHEMTELCVKSFANIIEPSGLRHLDATLVDANWDRLERTDEHRARFPTRYHSCLHMLLNVLEDMMQLDLNPHSPDNSVQH